MTARLQEAPQDTRPASATGYIDAMTETAALGWAWIPGEARPVAVELHLDGDVVSVATADVLREDLARLGIGDGRHAFALPVPADLRPRLADLRVVVRTNEGAVVPLGSPPAADGVTERLVQLNRGMEMLIGSQRVLHRNVQAALLSGPKDAGPTVDVAAAQAALQDGIATLELFVTRLEAGMAGMAARPEPARPRWALAGVAATAGAALVLSGWALLLALPG